MHVHTQIHTRIHMYMRVRLIEYESIATTTTVLNRAELGFHWQCVLERGRRSKGAGALSGTGCSGQCMY